MKVGGCDNPNTHSEARKLSSEGENGNFKSPLRRDWEGPCDFENPQCRTSDRTL
jgi:hypothetical protein